MCKRAIVYFLSIIFCPAVQASAEYSEDSLAMSFGDEEFVSIATGRKQALATAPAVASVITSNDIKKLGIRDLSEALELVPGLHVSVQAAGYNPIYVMRGVASEFNPQVLLLINGNPITNVFLGNRGQVWGGMPVDNISRIEVIRGPGSAIYGADAFAGTVNIITKTAEEIDGVESGFSFGSYDEARFWVLYGSQLNEWRANASIEILDTQGHREIIESDLQSIFDLPAPFGFGSDASFAPGGVNLSMTSYDMKLGLANEYWSFRIGYHARRNGGTGAGANQALDPLGKGDSDRLHLDISYQNTLKENWDLSLQWSHFNISNRADLFLLPPGFAGLFPEGVIGNPDVYERHNRADISLFYTGFNSHDIRFGIGFHHQDLYRVEESKNYDITLDPTLGLLILPLGDLIDVTNLAPFTQEKTREIFYISLQDEWKFARDWSLTAGVRIDEYSDFGSTVNPRLALVWQTSYQLTTKFLYGRAFRAPSFAEQFNINNPVALGNEDLDPEIVNTYEVAFDYTHSDQLKLGLNLFAYRMEDIIRFDPTVANNTGDQTGHGLELEFEWSVTDDLTLIGNYAYQNSEDEDSNSDAPNAPAHQIYVRGDYAISEYWDINAQLNMVMDRSRAAGDFRPEIDDYTTLDITIRAKDLFAGADLSFSVRNAGDEDVREPSLFDRNLGLAAIPHDLPLAGRSFFAELRKSW